MLTYGFQRLDERVVILPLWPRLHGMPIVLQCSVDNVELLHGLCSKDRKYFFSVFNSYGDRVDSTFAICIFCDYLFGAGYVIHFNWKAENILYRWYSHVPFEFDAIFC